MRWLMRRADREVKDEKRIDEIIRACDCCRLGFIDGDSVYIVPLNFGFAKEDGKRVFYFHSAREGKKIELIKANPVVGFELDTNHSLHAGEKACDYSFSFSSVIGKGRISLVNDVDEKKKGFQHIMNHYAGNREWQFTDADVGRVAIIRMEVIELSCKEHI